MLDGDNFADSETFQDVPTEPIREMLKNWRNVFQLYEHVQSGMISLTLQEYESLPHYVVETWTLYKNIRTEITEKKRPV